MKRPALQNKRVGVLTMAFRAGKVFGTFEKRAPGPSLMQRKAQKLQVNGCEFSYARHSKSYYFIIRHRPVFK